VIAVDTNILVYADRRELPKHAVALAHLRTLAEGEAAWALPVFCIGEFVRVVSHPRLFDPPTPPTEALNLVDRLLESPSVRLLYPADRFLRVFRHCVEKGGASGNLVFDALIAALCLEHGATTLLTEDRDFARFPDLQMRSLEG